MADQRAEETLLRPFEALPLQTPASAGRFPRFCRALSPFSQPGLSDRQYFGWKKARFYVSPGTEGWRRKLWMEKQGETSGKGTPPPRPLSPPLDAVAFSYYEASTLRLLVPEIHHPCPSFPPSLSLVLSLSSLPKPSQAVPGIYAAIILSPIVYYRRQRAVDAPSTGSFDACKLLVN